MASDRWISGLRQQAPWRFERLEWMGKSLLIVESPAKARTLKGYLGKDFQVEASVGHVKDLPKSELGVDVDGGFEPSYNVIRGKGKVLQKL